LSDRSKSSQRPRQRLTDSIIEAKTRKNLSFEQISEGSGLRLGFVTAELLGQHALPGHAAKIVAARLDLGEDAVASCRRFPFVAATDPTIYRFYEIVQVYGSTLKALVHEIFGDGTISAINFKLDTNKVDDPEGGSRAVITLDGTYLPTKPL
jgi:cyanate lyase